MASRAVLQDAPRYDLARAIHVDFARMQAADILKVDDPEVRLGDLRRRHGGGAARREQTEDGCKAESGDPAESGPQRGGVAMDGHRAFSRKCIKNKIIANRYFIKPE